MGLELSFDAGQTPLDEEEKEGLRIASLTTKAELDELEQRNIEQAVRWTIERRRKFDAREILTEQFIMALHKRMFGDVWKWAGSFRSTDKNLGVSKYYIGTELRKLLDDAAFWVENNSFPDDEIAIRFKHRIVSIHCFANGNGRHSRLMADIIAEKLFGAPVFSWGAINLSAAGEARSKYLAALRDADKGEYKTLILLARS